MNFKTYEKLSKFLNVSLQDHKQKTTTTIIVFPRARLSVSAKIIYINLILNFHHLQIDKNT